MSEPLSEMGLEATGASIPDYLDRRAGVPALTKSRCTPATIQSRRQRRAGARARHPRDAFVVRDTRSRRRARPHIRRRRGAVGRDRVVVLGDAMWRNRFNADPASSAATCVSTARAIRVIGVMPRGIHVSVRDTGLYVPFAFTPAQNAGRPARFRILYQHRAACPGRDARRSQGAMRSRDPAQSRSHRSDRRRRSQFARIHEVGGFTRQCTAAARRCSRARMRMLMLLQLAVALCC